MKKILSILLIIALMFTLVSCAPNSTAGEDLNSFNYVTTPATTENASSSGNDSQSTPFATETPAPPSDSYFQVHFIDVGQADSALIICDGKTMLIDGGNVNDSSLLVSYRLSPTSRTLM
jgi:beta-lactamase superfamily II metal-dependent hydrolase